MRGNCSATVRAVTRYRWLWNSCAVAVVVAVPMGALVWSAYDSIILAAMAAALLAHAVIVAVIAIRGGIHPTGDTHPPQPAGCEPTPSPHPPWCTDR